MTDFSDNDGRVGNSYFARLYSKLKLTASAKYKVLKSYLKKKGISKARGEVISYTSKMLLWTVSFFIKAKFVKYFIDKILNMLMDYAVTYLGEYFRSYAAEVKLAILDRLKKEYPGVNKNFVESLDYEDLVKQSLDQRTSSAKEYNMSADATMIETAFHDAAKDSYSAVNQIEVLDTMRLDPEIRKDLSLYLTQFYSDGRRDRALRNTPYFTYTKTGERRLWGINHLNSSETSAELKANAEKKFAKNRAREKVLKDVLVLLR